jgi:hypothetical protein
MATKQLSTAQLDFRTDITPQDKNIFNQLLKGEQQEGDKVLSLLKQFFN